MKSDLDDTASLDNESDDPCSFLHKNVEFEPCPLPVEEGQTTLQLYVDIDFDSDPKKYDTLSVFDNNNKLYPFTPKRYVKNGSLIDMNFNNLESEQENNDITKLK